MQSDAGRAVRIPLLAGLVLTLLATACSTASSPYSRLTDLELSYVIPDSGQWAEGNPCAEGDCSGDVDSSTLRSASWFVIDDIAATDGDIGTEATIEVVLSVVGPVREPEQRAEMTATAWGQNVGWVLEAMTAGHEIWAATGCGGLDSEYVCHFVAIDDRDRFAGIGYGAAGLFTTPLAREAAHHGSLSGRQFLEDLI